jgi:VIT1/CCC1 family predicted Fe2+/Mn2+ transporter
MGGLVSMFICLVIIGALGAVQTKVSGASLGIGIVLVICTLFNMVGWTNELKQIRTD